MNDNLKNARKAARLTQAELAAKIGITQSGYSDWERGETKIDSASLSRLSEILEVSIDYLVGKTNSPGNRYIRIPVLGRVAAGIPIDAIEEIIDWEDINASTAADGEYFGLVIKGRSMEPKISDGDTVIVRKQPDVRDGEIAVVLVNGDEGTVKKIKKGPHGVTLISSNPAYDPMFLRMKRSSSSLCRSSAVSSSFAQSCEFK